MNNNEVDELEMQKEFEKIEKLAEMFEIEHATWCMELPSDFNKMIVEGVFTVKINLLEDFVEVEDPTYLDIWEICDFYNVVTEDWDHAFIENITVDIGNKEISIFMGS